MNDKTLIVKLEAHDVAWVDPPNIGPEEASMLKGCPHPGSILKLPGGYELPIQFNESPLIRRNGLFMTEVIEAIIDNLSAYQTPGHKMRTRETALAITALEDARNRINQRQLDRQRRDVRFTDEA